MRGDFDLENWNGDCFVLQRRDKGMGEKAHDICW